MIAPPFCPNPGCACHVHPPTHRWWHSVGFHHTRCFGPVPRFRCLACRRTFSTQTFSTNYYAKRKLDFRRLENLLASSMSVRSLARSLGCSCGSVLNRIDRLARQAVAAHAQLRPQALRHEDVCIDGLVSFDRSLYFPNNITLSITADSQYALSFTHASVRRSGSMRADQKNRRDALYRGLRFEPRSIERSFTQLMDELERDRPPRRYRPLVIITDEKREYEWAFLAHRLYRDQDGERRVVHRTVNSRLPRTVHNPLFPSNYLDREIRKDQAAHRRESTCFGRSVANGMSRMACYLGWHNYRKPFRVKAPVAEQQCHGEEAGIPGERIKSLRRSMFCMRAFLSLTALDGMEERIWKKTFPTPGSTRSAPLPTYAFD
jgi:transposase-like protein